MFNMLQVILSALLFASLGYRVGVKISVVWSEDICYLE